AYSSNEDPGGGVHAAFVIVRSACERAVMILASPVHSYKIVVSAQALSVRRAYKGRGSFEDGARPQGGEVRGFRSGDGREGRREERQFRPGVPTSGLDWQTGEGHPRGLRPAMMGRLGPKDLAECGRCGSGQAHPRLVVMGPSAGMDRDSSTFV